MIIGLNIILTRNKWFNDILMPLNSKAKNNFSVYGFDTETIHVRDDFSRKSGKLTRCYRQDFYMGSVVGKDFKRVFYDRKEMGDFLLYNLKFRNSMIFAHNLEFDFQNLYYDRLKDFNLIHRHRLLGAVYRYHDGFNRRKVTFSDTMNFMSHCSLDSLGKIVNMPKMEHPPCFEKGGIFRILSRPPKDDDEKHKLEMYNLNDSAITYQFAELLREYCNKMNMKLKFTIGSSGLDYWRRNYQKEPLRKEPEWMIRKHFQGSFRGGLTYVLKRGTYTGGKIWHYDYNSSYPSCLVKGVDGKGSYPYVNKAYHTLNPTDSHLEYEGICLCDVKSPESYFPFLSVRSDMTENKLINPYGSFSGWFCNNEIRKCLDLGYEIDMKEMIYYPETWIPFKECVNILYKMRKEYKLNNHQFEGLVKITMNSGLFGKWGTNFLNNEEMIPMENIIINENGEMFYKGDLIKNPFMTEALNVFNGFVTRKKEGKPPRYSFPIISEYTTALGRIKLWTDIHPHEKDIIYMDTDSAFCMRPCFETSNELGSWKLEHDDIYKGIFIRPKFYAYYTESEGLKTKSKGVGSFMDKDNYIECLNEKFVPMSRFLRMKESNRLGIKSGSVIECSKDLHFEDDKRLWEKDFNIDEFQDSKALLIDNGIMYNKENILKMNILRNKRDDHGFSYDSKGDDISKEEFFKNETDWRFD